MRGATPPSKLFLLFYGAIFKHFGYIYILRITKLLALLQITLN